MWVAFLPMAGGREPVWQLEQVPVASLWLNAFIGDQALVVWQSSQVLLVEKCVADLPVALVPLWQETQLPVSPAWLKVAGVQALVLWQVPQSAAVAM
jgi:hypothetical protein